MPVSALFLDASPEAGGWGRSLAFDEALESHQAWALGEVVEVAA